jgi:hypothetical protein
VHDEIFKQIYGKTLPLQFNNNADVLENLTHPLTTYATDSVAQPKLSARFRLRTTSTLPSNVPDAACARARLLTAKFLNAIVR